MDRFHRIRRRAKVAWMLLALALVSVLAPVWADMYLCPMAEAARDAREQATCCDKSAGLHGQVAPSQERLEPPCDCPKLSWSSDATDQVRELRSISDNTPAIREFPLFAQTARPILSVVSRQFDLRRGGATERAWLRNLAILC